jgi:drug/metabolite transporter (DMT)-like permease
VPSYYLTIGIAITGSVLYHVFQKATSANVNPALGLIVTYLTALTLTVPLVWVFPREGTLREALGRVNWASFALGLAIVLLEVGFLLAYRAGWNLSLASLASNATAALLLLPVGVLFFRDRPTAVNLLGVIVCLVGLVLINLRR